MRWTRRGGKKEGFWMGVTKGGLGEGIRGREGGRPKVGGEGA